MDSNGVVGQGYRGQAARPAPPIGRGQPAGRAQPATRGQPGFRGRVLNTAPPRSTPSLNRMPPVTGVLQPEAKSLPPPIPPKPTLTPPVAPITVPVAEISSSQAKSSSPPKPLPTPRKSESVRSTPVITIVQKYSFQELDADVESILSNEVRPAIAAEDWLRAFLAIEKAGDLLIEKSEMCTEPDLCSIKALALFRLAEDDFYCRYARVISPDQAYGLHAKLSAPNQLASQQLNEVNDQYNKLRESLQQSHFHQSGAKKKSLLKGLGSRVRSVASTTQRVVKNASGTIQTGVKELNKALETPEQQTIRLQKEATRAEAIWRKQAEELTLQGNALVSQGDNLAGFPLLEQAADLWASHSHVQELPVAKGYRYRNINPDLSHIFSGDSGPSIDATTEYLRRAIAFYQILQEYVVGFPVNQQVTIMGRLQNKLLTAQKEIKQRPDLAYSFKEIETEVVKGPEQAEALLREIQVRGTLFDEINAVILMEYHDIYYKAPLQPLLEAHKQLQTPMGNSAAFVESWKEMLLYQYKWYGRTVGDFYPLSSVLNRDGTLKHPQESCKLSNQSAIVLDPASVQQILQKEVTKVKDGQERLVKYYSAKQIVISPTRLSMITIKLLEAAQRSHAKGYYLDIFFCMEQIANYHCVTATTNDEATEAAYSVATSYLKTAEEYCRVAQQLTQYLADGYRGERLEKIQQIRVQISAAQAKADADRARGKRKEEEKEKAREDLRRDLDAYRPSGGGGGFNPYGWGIQYSATQGFHYGYGYH